MLTEQDFINQGYKKFTQRFLNQADFGLQKLIKDEKGKKYYITVYAFDLSKYSIPDLGYKISFQPEVQFKAQSGEYLDVSMILNTDTGILTIEKYFEEIFQKMNIQYYELWD
jgi:hypothetical protein